MATVLAVDHGPVALELVEESANPRRFHVRSMTEADLEDRLEADQIGNRVNVLLLDAPADWPALQRAAVIRHWCGSSPSWWRSSPSCPSCPRRPLPFCGRTP